ncbi:hypothetical protein PIB30_010466 [Stylosanthes scabra]|uniref:Uncharacterized protein n=1 Tax=Stylosanthes scabra TaxID=79078 RepID=A0ABU6Z5Z7_9FABA|nr:hypothetical protein [Stylosanthes scabra]
MAVEYSPKLMLPLLLTLVVVAGLHYCEAGRNKCTQRCGKVDIPFPFGTTMECSLEPKFLVRCTNNNSDPILQDNDRPLRSISLDQGLLRVSLPAAKDCYTGTLKKFKNIESIDWLYDFGSYSMSSSQNEFTTIGCDTLGIVVGYPYSDSFFDKPYAKTCLSYCEKPGDATTGTCAGTGCCHVDVPGSEFKQGLSFISYTFENSLLNNSDKIEFSPCGYAFVAEKEYYKFMADDLISNRLKNITVPVVLDWSVGNLTCEEAKKNNSTYACKGMNVVCYPARNRPGYLCNCTTGFQGNPYLPQGCTDINECLGSHDCVKGTRCHNDPPGNYTCECPKGLIGDGRNNGTKCQTPKPATRNILIIALIVSLSILALFVVGSNAYCGLKKRKLNKLKEQFFQQNGGLLLQQKIAKHRGSIQTAKIFSIKELKKATNNFDEDKILGRGGQGIVYKGVLQDDTIVAIKKSKISDQRQIEQFINEVIILSQINHTNVVKLLGCCLETQVPLLVYEFIQGGTLYDHLHAQRQSLRLNWKARLRIAAETAGALAYLHSATCPPIIHRDVKTTNILLDHNLKAKVSDFGASKIVPLDNTELSTLVKGTLGYLDPEYFHTSYLTEKSDVYSFGVVLAELLTGRKALCFELPENDRNLAMYFVSSMNHGRLHDIMDKAIIEEAKPEQLMEFANMSKRCLRVKGEERPTMKEVAAELEGLRIMEKNMWESVRSSLEETKILLNASSSSSSSAFYSESIGQITVSLGGR